VRGEREGGKEGGMFIYTRDLKRGLSSSLAHRSRLFSASSLYCPAYTLTKKHDDI